MRTIAVKTENHHNSISQETTDPPLLADLQFSVFVLSIAAFFLQRYVATQCDRHAPFYLAQFDITYPPLVAQSQGSANRQLLKAWHNYQKPADSRTLMNKFSHDDLVRTAKSDSDLRGLLIMIGLTE